MRPPESELRQPPPERVVARLRRHGRRLVLPAIVLIALAGGAAYGSGILLEDWQRWALLGGSVLLVLLVCLLPFLSWLAGRVTITDRRVIATSGVFVRVRRELPLRRGYDVTVRRTPGQRMAGSGDVRIEVGRERPFVLKDLPAPMQVQQALHELIAAAPSVAPLQPAQTDADTVAWGRR
ncbi:PH domain-containing protein [Agromyces mediolanus]|uniref:PH domain-containing protein n=1 Tax=Agromyces mediolanus TaxID=41986 RepID=UPI003835905D